MSETESINIMGKYLFLIFSLLSAVVQGAWADNEKFGGGDGSAKNPYIINTSDYRSRMD